MENSRNQSGGPHWYNAGVQSYGNLEVPIIITVEFITILAIIMKYQALML